MSGSMTLLSDTLHPFSLISVFVYSLCFLYYAWNLECKFYRLWILLTLFLECLPHNHKEPQSYVCLFCHSCWICNVNPPPPTHTPLPATSRILCRSQWFLCSWCMSKWKGDWNVKRFSFVVICFVYGLHTFMMNRYSICLKLSEKQKNSSKVSK